MKLALFFTNNVSLESWQKTGNLDREVKPYQRLLNYFEKIYFLTYGNNEPEIKNIKVLPAIIFNKEFKKIDVFKTNQLNGSWKAVIAKRIYKKKLVVRQGYQWSVFAKKKNIVKWKRLLIYLIEKFAYRNADTIMVSSKRDQQYIIDKYKIKPEKVNYLPNYIDTDLFKPLDIEKENRICIVAKLEKQKNLKNLIEAVRGLDIKLVIFGKGSLSKKLRSLAPSNVRIIESIPNNDLPEEINKSKLFILPSNFEGCPKALLEAMSCQVPVIGTNVYGIKEIIKHKENGYLCDTSIESIRNAIKQVLADQELQKKISFNARKTILNNFSLEKLLDKEIKIYQTL
jgi:glycosyltransferase involved in cell wall biosynthesis